MCLGMTEAQYAIGGDEGKSFCKLQKCLRGGGKKVQFPTQEKSTLKITQYSNHFCVGDPL